MRKRPLTQRALAVLIVPLVFAVGTGSAHALFRCAFDDVTRSKCCCPGAAAADAPEHAALEASSCCDIEIVTSAAANDARAQAERVMFDKLHQAVVSAFVTLSPVTASPTIGRETLGRPPPQEPSLLLRKQSFLI
jgi:hypothetical protein